MQRLKSRLNSSLHRVVRSLGLFTPQGVDGHDVQPRAVRHDRRLQRVLPAASAHPLCFGWKWNSWIFFPEFKALKLAPQSSVTQFIPLLPIRIYFMIQYL